MSSTTMPDVSSVPVAINCISLSDLKHLIKDESVLVGFGIEGCCICSYLRSAFSVALFGADLGGHEGGWAARTPLFTFAWVTYSSYAEIEEIGLALRTVPTVIGFCGGQPKIGWEGFASLSPDEVKAEMIQQAISSFTSISSHYPSID